jgi:hypothetical protein
LPEVIKNFDDRLIELETLRQQYEMRLGQLDEFKARYEDFENQVQPDSVALIMQAAKELRLPVDVSSAPSV